MTDQYLFILVMVMCISSATTLVLMSDRIKSEWKPSTTSRFLSLYGIAGVAFILSEIFS